VGIPNQLYLLPETVGAEDFKKEYDGRDLIEIEDSVNVSTENYSTYQEYFSYSAGVLGIGQMQTWRDALAAYERLLEAAETLIQTSSTCSVFTTRITYMYLFKL
jgi:hypothetical protein